MILTNLGNGNIDCGKCLLNYGPQQVFDFRVSSSDGQKLEGKIPASGFANVTPPGKAPWTVEMGSLNFSRSATATGITSPDAVVSAILVFPMGPNDGHAFVNQQAAL
jgi:hypothetical protein